MTLQSTSSEASLVRPQTLPPSVPSRSEAGVVVLDTPVAQKLHRGDCPNTPLGRAEPEAVVSPSVSAAISALHLSDIDWDSLSFTSSPAPATSRTPEPTDGGVHTDDSGSALEPHCSDCPLRDRVLMRNTSRAVKQRENNRQQQRQPPDDVPLSTNDAPIEAHASNRHLTFDKQAPRRTENQSRDCRKPPQKSTFVRSAVSSSAAQTQRCHSDPGHSDRDVSTTHTAKKSVCMSVCSSSDDSDAENRQARRQRRIRATHRTKGPVSDAHGPKRTKPPVAPISGPRSQLKEADVGLNRVPATTDARCHDDVFLQAPTSPITVSDSDESAVCGDSPLPLAERLRLKFLK